MKVKYFADTDTMYLELADRPATDTREISSNLLVDYDESGLVVGLTIEHAKHEASAPDFSFQMIGTTPDVVSKPVKHGSPRRKSA